jgi:DNA replication protein DnaC
VICATCAKKMFQDIPPKFRDQPAKWRNITLEHLADENALFIGEPGSGKSTQAAFLMRLRFSRGQPAKWISVPSLILRLQADYDHAYDALTTVITFDGLLVLDDFGGSKVTPFVHQCLYEIINHRESYLLLTLITSNYTLDQISDQIDDRISSRIAGMCNGGKNVRHFTGDKRIGT